MNITSIFQRFPNQDACIAHLEKALWADQPRCPHCGSTRVARKEDQGRVGRWNCHDCKSSFNVLSGTIFEKTRIPLQKWFLGIALIVKARKRLSSCQLARDLNMNQKSAWYMQQRIRTAMASKQGKILLSDIAAADEDPGRQDAAHGQRISQ
ncbi:MAG: IS1595 family transposase [Rhodospirillaceae bacterium]|nr:IS1595 family transposase [Rhodospirillaceae bacterium]MCY4312017.1 IS1595 family transposase [Rhodospirillaceae bacterium]